MFCKSKYFDSAALLSTFLSTILVLHVFSGSCFSVAQSVTNNNNELSTVQPNLTQSSTGLVCRCEGNQAKGEYCDADNTCRARNGEVVVCYSLAVLNANDNTQVLYNKGCVLIYIILKICDKIKQLGNFK
ncbi:hypothetical protein EB796_004993 [Bugula neritina]|uniref:Uncharacterized protein n=1 Tax=Bugula neritina TaxID=10212 RepID=A0A7J7KGC0_BUGNE|nr:hypothetical protein EB796_004993 [Bugula neritina]